MQDTGSFRNFRLRKVGEVKIDKLGDCTLSVRVDDKPGRAVMDLRAVTLTPPNEEEQPIQARFEEARRNTSCAGQGRRTIARAGKAGKVGQIAYGWPQRQSSSAAILASLRTLTGASQSLR